LHALVDDGATSQPLSAIEQAELYAEYEQLYAKPAALRKQATHFEEGNSAAVIRAISGKKTVPVGHRNR